jgi:uracil-DNA glycosylase family 4
METFFPVSEAMSSKRTPLPLMIPKCGACGIKDMGCKSPKMLPTGKGKRKILILGEAPGEEEDKQKRQFVGKTGQELRKVLRANGLDPNVDCWFDNALRCRPPNNKIPKEECVEYCRPNIVKTVLDLKPEIIIPLGGTAVKSLLGWLYKDQVGGIMRWSGFDIPCQKINAWICPTYHPRYVMEQDKKGPVVRMLWEKHLRTALRHKHRPWRKAPNFLSRVQTTLDTSKARDIILKRFCTRTKRPVAFDFETDRLKPDHKDATIICCSISDGELTIAYPWDGPAIDATWKLLESKVPKIGYNAKFEERWKLRFTGKGVRNWRRDGQLTAHIIDNRKEIVALKFQAFAMLGQEPWDEHIKPYLEADDGNSMNRIRELDLDSVLKYCGMDALMEWKLAMKQKKVLGF